MSACPSCGLPGELVDDGQGLGLDICKKCKTVADILDTMHPSRWPGNDLPFAEAVTQPLQDWMRLCHAELLPAAAPAGGVAADQTEEPT